MLAGIARHPDAARAHDQLAIEYEDRLRSGYDGLISIEECVDVGVAAVG